MFLQKIIYFIFFTLIFSFLAQAQENKGGLDYSATVDAGYPVGGGINGWLGYGHLLWGKKEKQSWHYGYVRPLVRLYTVGVINRAETRIQVYPISIAGISAGVATSHRNWEFEDYNCQQVACGGFVHHVPLEGNLKLGYGPVFGGILYRAEYLYPSWGESGFVEETTGLLGASGSDWLGLTQVTFGVTVKVVWRVLMQGSHWHMLTSGKNLTEWGVGVGYDVAPGWHIRVSVATSQRTGFERGVSGGLHVAWTGAPSLEL